MYDPQKLLMASTYDGDGNRAFQLNYNTEAECGYGKNVSGEIFMPEHSTNEDGSLTAEGELFGYICSATGRAYDLTEYVNDTNREHAQVLMAYNINTDFDTESYVYAGDQRLSRNNIWNEARDVNHDEMSYYLYDGRGSVTANTWYNGMVTDVYQYDPYGQVTLGSTKHTDFYGYNAESYNPNTGLEYLRARYYNAEEGRFFQEDTNLGDATDPLTLNRYAYVKNSPLNYVDPSGHEPIDEEFLLGQQDSQWAEDLWNEFHDAGNQAADYIKDVVKNGGQLIINGVKTSVNDLKSQMNQAEEWIEENLLICGGYINGASAKIFEINSDGMLELVSGKEISKEDLAMVLATYQAMTELSGYDMGAYDKGYEHGEAYNHLLKTAIICALADAVGSGTLGSGIAGVGEHFNSGGTRTQNVQLALPDGSTYSIEVEINVGAAAEGALDAAGALAGVVISKGNNGGSKGNIDEWDEYLDDESPRNSHVGKQNKNTPRNNQKQNEQIDKVVKELNLNKKQRRQLHDEVSHQGYGYKEILEIAKDLFGKE